MELDLDQKKIEQLVVERCSEKILSKVGYGCDYDSGHDYEYDADSNFQQKIQTKVQEHIDRRIDEIASTHVIPKVEEHIKNLVLQETNKWGEKKGKPVTFVEYMVGRAEQYMLEPVDIHGKPKGSSFRGSDEHTRLVYMLEQMLCHDIEKAVKEILSAANLTFTESIRKTVQMQLKQITDKISVPKR